MSAEMETGSRGRPVGESQAASGDARERAGLDAPVDPAARERLRHTPEGEPPKRMIGPVGLVVAVAVMFLLVAGVSVFAWLSFGSGPGLLALVLGASLLIGANPIVWAAVFRLREHRAAKRHE